MDSGNTHPVSLLRQFAAIVYDWLLLAAVFFFASLPLIMLSGNSIRSGQIGYQLYLLGICFLYYTWQWLHGGQTLGMKAWHIRLVSKDGTPITLPAALTRLVSAMLSVFALGLGFFWSLVDRQRLSWHDRASGTRLIRINTGGY